MRLEDKVASKIRELFPWCSVDVEQNKESGYVEANIIVSIKDVKRDIREWESKKDEIVSRLERLEERVRRLEDANKIIEQMEQDECRSEIGGT